MIEQNNCCVICGKIIPEGTQFCSNCFADIMEETITKTMDSERNEIQTYKNA